MQRELIVQAHALLKGGGRLVYSTCSIYAQENEAQVRWLLSEFPDMRLVVARPRLGADVFFLFRCLFVFSLDALCVARRQGGDGLAGHCDDETRRLVQRFDPLATNAAADVAPSDTIGFFVAAFEKQKSH